MVRNLCQGRGHSSWILFLDFQQEAGRSLAPVCDADYYAKEDCGDDDDDDDEGVSWEDNEGAGVLRKTSQPLQDFH